MVTDNITVGGVCGCLPLVPLQLIPHPTMGKINCNILYGSTLHHYNKFGKEPYTNYVLSILRQKRHSEHALHVYGTT
jgi:hypothetical protein